MNTPQEYNEEYQTWLKSQDKVECMECGELVSLEHVNERYPVCETCAIQLINEHSGEPETAFPI